MTRSLPILLAVAVTACSLAQPATTVAADPGAAHVLGLGRFDCGHVIDLLLHNTARRRHGVMGLHVTPEDQLLGAPAVGDLKLLDVHLVSPATADCGPTFQVRIHNDSEVAASRFHITLVAVLGHIQPHSPCATLAVPCLKPDEIGCFQIQLPLAAQGMGRLDGQPLPFNKLVVAVDSFDELVECDELNNVAVLKRGEIALLEVPAAEAPAEAVPPSTQPAPDAEAQPDREGEPAPAPADPVRPPSPRIDLDELDLDEADQSATLLGW